MGIVKVNSATLRHSAHLSSRQQPPRLQLSNEPLFVPIGAVVLEMWSLTGAVKTRETLLHAEPSGYGVAILGNAPWVKEKATLEWMCNYELANREFATLGEGGFEVYPAYACPVERGDSDKPKASKSKPYDQPPLPMRRTMPPEEVNTAPAPNRAYVKIPLPPRILKQPLMPQEDEPMMDGEFTPREKGKQRATPSTSCPPAPHSMPKSNTTHNKVTFEEPNTPDSPKTPAL
ncbi:uncharacterized protein EI90DRAFT_3128764 [Cantharellus anzutake]|uniref:uncharacterized protein n=1 Tax=Cantharellus anzutake TaxID=1750568 RepID=UPI001907448F|nr:uncharacterized protein EI90DRAFT_3128764 [Cantharellus anzutake]KAF8325412.1 hypothetical protein EI90DRAFT_3128764 [Cantharellus anzutake]